MRKAACFIALFLFLIASVSAQAKEESQPSEYFTKKSENLPKAPRVKGLVAIGFVLSDLTFDDVVVKDEYLPQDLWSKEMRKEGDDRMVVVLDSNDLSFQLHDPNNAEWKARTNSFSITEAAGQLHVEIYFKKIPDILPRTIKLTLIPGRHEVTLVRQR